VNNEGRKSSIKGGDLKKNCNLAWTRGGGKKNPRYYQKAFGKRAVYHEKEGPVWQRKISLRETLTSLERNEISEKQAPPLSGGRGKGGPVHLSIWTAAKEKEAISLREEGGEEKQWVRGKGHADPSS